MPSSPLICLYCFFFQCSLTHRHLHSFPTRRSSDLVTGMTARPEFSAVSFNLIPTVGEYFVFPALTTTGACEIMVFEGIDRKSTRLNSSHRTISYAVFCLKKKKKNKDRNTIY